MQSILEELGADVIIKGVRSSADLDIDLRTLQRTVTFYRTYRRRPPRIEGLSWAHYRILMQLQDPAGFVRRINTLLFGEADADQ